MHEIRKNLFVRRFIETVGQLDFMGYQDLKDSFSLLSADERDEAVMDILILLWQRGKKE